MVDVINVHDLPEEQAKLVKEFVEFLRGKLKNGQLTEEKEENDKGWGKLALTSFAEDWENEKDAIYDNWRERYNVSEG